MHIILLFTAGAKVRKKKTHTNDFTIFFQPRFGYITKSMPC